MKKIFFLISFCFSYNIYSLNICTEICAEYNINGKHRINVKGPLAEEYPNAENIVRNSLTTSLQTGIFITKNIEFGIGLKYQIPIEFKYLEGEFNFAPIYFFTKGSFLTGENINPYIIGQFGYNFFAGDSEYYGRGELTGKYYYGLGLGLILLGRINFGLLYSVNTGSNDSVYMIDNLEADIKYSKIGLLFGFCSNLQNF